MGIPADYWRYYLATIRPEKSDSNFDRQGFITAINELADKYGNLVYRVLSLHVKYHEGKPPALSPHLDPQEVTFNATMRELWLNYTNAFDEVRIVSAVQIAMRTAQETNKYLYKREPWKMTDYRQRADVCTLALLATHTVSQMLSPIIPSIHAKFCSQLGISEKCTFMLYQFDTIRIRDISPLIDKTCLKVLE